jgi:hypothetical protein
MIGERSHRERDGINQILVKPGDNMVGMLSRPDFVKYLPTLWQVVAEK